MRSLPQKTLHMFLQTKHGLANPSQCWNSYRMDPINSLLRIDIIWWKHRNPIGIIGQFVWLWSMCCISAAMDFIHILLRQNVSNGGWECREWIVNTEQSISRDEIGLAYYENQTGWDYSGYDTVCKDWTISLYVLDLMDSAVLGSIHVVF